MLTNAILQTLFESCHNLVEIEIYADTLTTTTTTTTDLVDEPVLTARYPTLTKLTVRGDGMSDCALCDIFTYSNNLREVNLINYTHITDDTIKVLSQSCCKLEALLLDSYITPQLTVDGLSYISTYCTNLTSLQLIHMSIDDEFLIQLSQHCINLKIIYLDHCGYTNTTNTADNTIPIKDSDPVTVRNPISETGILAILDKCIRLKIFTISECNITSTYTLQMIEEGRLYPHVSFVIDV